jgi:hypothetical protein
VHDRVAERVHDVVRGHADGAASHLQIVLKLKW